MLTAKEQGQLVRLMRKAEFPLPREVFNAWCENFTVPCIELAIVRKTMNDRELFLTYREDEFYKGWHIPGAVIQPGEKVEDVFERISRDELQGAKCAPRFFAWLEYLKGTGEGQSARGHTIALIFSADAPEMLRESNHAKFLPLSKIPGDLISEHMPIVKVLRKM